MIYRHFTTKALHRNLRRIERFDLCIVEQVPLVGAEVRLVEPVTDEAVVVTAVGRTRVYRHPYQLVLVPRPIFHRRLLGFFFLLIIISWNNIVLVIISNANHACLYGN